MDPRIVTKKPQKNDKDIVSQRIVLKRSVDESYDIIFGSDLFTRIATDIRESELPKTCAIITDSNVGPLYAQTLRAALTKNGLHVSTYTFTAGEKSKCIQTCMKIIEQMFTDRLGRDTTILALGGGVVGDLAGFIASIFNRGVAYIQIPTSVLAQGDSSIGGKTAIDIPAGKNLVGAFKQPWRVYIDVSTLKTLPDVEFANGLAETIKHGIIADSNLITFIEKHIPDIIKKNQDIFLQIAQKNCRIKATIVEHDPHEVGIRRILNYGHTIGHAIELRSDFAISHGQAVAIGMMVEGRIAVALGMFSQEDLKRQSRLLERVGLPTKVPYALNTSDIIQTTTTDKKAIQSRARFALPKEIGSMHECKKEYVIDVPDAVIKESIDLSR